MNKKGKGELLTVTQAAELAGYEVSAMRRLVSAGKIPAQLVGKYYVIERSALDAFMASGDYRKKAGRPRKNS